MLGNFESHKIHITKKHSILHNLADKKDMYTFKMKYHSLDAHACVHPQAKSKEYIPVHQGLGFVRERRCY